MDLKKLEYFLTVAKEGHLTRAAKILHMSQPPLSYQIKAFEQELGIQLIEKTGRNIKLTEQGRILYEQGPLILDMVNETVKSLYESTSKLQKPLTIGNCTPWGYTILPNLISAFKSSYPQTKISLKQSESYHIIDLLNSEIIEIGFVTLPVNSAIYESKLLNVESLYAFFGAAYNYGQHANHITLKELADCPALMVHYHSYNLLTAYYKQLGIEPKSILQNDNINCMLDYTATHPWIAFAPKSIYDFSPRPNIKYKLIAEPPLEVHSYIVWLKSHNLSKTARCFIEMTLDKFKPLTSEGNADIYEIIGKSNWLKKRAIL
jgi:LysR family transcriptional regulator, salicylic acid-responsive activator of bsdBCD